MKNFLLFLTISLFFSNSAFSESTTDKKTIITTDGGIKLFQKEKYYDLDKNVDLKSKNFDLTADNVIAYYDNDFYDIVKIIATGNAEVITSEGSLIKGDKVTYETKSMEFVILGNGFFINENLNIEGDDIKGNFIKIGEESFVEDIQAKMFGNSKTVYIQNKEMKSYSKSAKYQKKTEILELFENVKIIKDTEITTGDYAEIDMLTNNYSIKSINNKVQLLIDSES